MSKTHIIGYEVDSKQVRAYETNDLDSVYRALSANTQEYLAFEGVEEDPPIKLAEVLIQSSAIGIAIYLFVTKVTLQVNPAVTVACFATFATLLGGVMLSGYMQQLDGVVFQGTGKVRSDPSPRPLFASLQGRRLRILVQTQNFSPEVKLIAQIVHPPRLFHSSRIVKAVEKKVQYGKYFGSTGFFYPPALTRDLDSLIERLGTGKK